VPVYNYKASFIWWCAYVKGKRWIHAGRVVGGNLDYCVVACNADTVIAKGKGASQASDMPVQPETVGHSVFDVCQ
jgi:hypothetical protein